VSDRPGTSGTLARDAVVVALLGVAIALAANALSPRGLRLNRDYFPAAPSAPAAPAPGAEKMAAAAPPGGPATATPLRTKHGLPALSQEQVEALFHDPGRNEQRIVFVDARDATHFAAGHIPGALRFDHYRPEADIANVLAAATIAERIVVYCTGGECEDSELAYRDLVALGVPEAKLAIYAGGFNEWTARRLPVQKEAEAGR
jgi:rhodanese-related sulfurtransferase